MNQAEPYDLPHGWIWTRLAEIAEKIVDGSHNPPAKQAFGMPMLSARNILNDRIDFRNARLVSEEDFEKEVKRVSIRPGDVLLTIVGTIGRSTVVKEARKFAVQRSVAVIKTKIEPWYLSFFFQSPWMESYFFEKAKGTAQKGIYLNKLKDVPIPLAPLGEQRRIVVKVEALFVESRTAREALDRVPVLLRRFRQSVLAKAFKGELTQRNPNDEPAHSLLQKAEQEERRQQTKTLESSKPRIDDFPTLPDTWVWAKLGKIATIVGGGTPRRDTPEYYENGTIPWVTPTDINPNGILTIFETAEKITEKALGKSSAKLLPTGTVLFSSRASIGKIAIAGRALATNQGFANLIPKPLLDFRYLAYGLRHFAKDIERLGSGTTYIEVAKSSLKEFYFPLAPLKEQRRVATKIQELFSFADTIEAAIKKAKERAVIIDQAILAKAFRGELVPQDPNDEPASILLKRMKDDLAKPRVEARREKAKTDYQSKLQTEEKQIKSLEEVLREIGPATIEQAFEASGLSMNEFWDKLRMETQAGRIEKSRKGNLIFLRVKN